jgi:diaminopimelate decarboxylase
MPDEISTNLQVIGQPVKEAFEAFAAETGRELHLEIEPGTYLVANAGCLLASVQDKTSTGTEGHVFLKLDTGMTDILRPTLYAAQHPMTVIPLEGDRSETESVIVVGHCCESGDLLTPDPSDPGLLKEREFTKAEIGDLFTIDGAGAYCSSMPAKNYNSFPEVPEVLLRENGEFTLIRKRQTAEQVYQNEVPLS